MLEAARWPPSIPGGVPGNSASLFYPELFNHETYTYAAGAVPEPASFWPLAVGLLGIIALRRRATLAATPPDLP